MDRLTQIEDLNFGTIIRAFHMDIEGVKFVVLAIRQADGPTKFCHLPLQYAEAFATELDSVIHSVTENRMVVVGPANITQVN